MPKSRTTTFGTSQHPTGKPQNGYFTKKQWHCNCQPRLPAIQFQVKRESANKGRWFYTCQVDRTKGTTGEPARCGFFLWAEEARTREEAAVLGNSTTEPGGSTQPNNGIGESSKQSLRAPRKLVQTTLSARVEPREEGKRHWTHRTEITSIGNLERAIGGGQKDDQDLVRPESTQSGGKAGVTGTAKSSATLRATNTTSDSRTVDRNYDTDMDTDDEDELSQITDSAIKSAAAAMRQESLQTPSLGSKRKRNVADSVYDNDDLFGDMDSDEERQLAAIADSTGQTTRKRDVFVTPAAQRTNDVATGMPTPSLTKESVRRVLFAERETGEASSTKRQCNDHADAYTSAGESTSPSSSQEADGVPSSPPTPGTGIGNLAHEVMELLRGQNIDNATLRNVRTSLDTYAAKAIGLERGRDATREALKQKDGKIAQLQMRVTALENTRKVDLAEKKKLKSGLMHLYSQT